MVNKRRGEVGITLDDKRYTLCLTLGALAELEDAMGLGNIGELADRFASGQVKSGDLITILGAALRAGGADVSDREAAGMQCSEGAAALTKALVDLLRLTFDPNAHLEDVGPSEGGEGALNPI